LRHILTNATLGSTLLAIRYISTAVVVLGALAVLINVGILMWFLWGLHF
jgi:hypothetical protein